MMSPSMSSPLGLNPQHLSPGCNRRRWHLGDRIRRRDSKPEGPGCSSIGDPGPRDGVMDTDDGAEDGANCRQTVSKAWGVGFTDEDGSVSASDAVWARVPRRFRVRMRLPSWCVAAGRGGQVHHRPAQASRERIGRSLSQQREMPIRATPSKDDRRRERLNRPE